MVDVFISYARAERPRVERIRDKLEALDLDVFFDLDRIDGGAVFPDVIDRALKASKTVLCCWSPLYFTRRWCLIECRFALERELLTPVRLEAFDRDAPPGDLMGINFYDLADWSGDDAHEGWNRTLRSLGQKLGRDLAPDLSRGRLGGLTAGPAPEPPELAVAQADLLEDLRLTWETFRARGDAAAVGKLLERVRAAAPGSGIEFEIEHHLDGLEREAAKVRAEAERAATAQFNEGYAAVGALKQDTVLPRQSVRIVTPVPTEKPTKSHLFAGLENGIWNLKEDIKEIMPYIAWIFLSILLTIIGLVGAGAVPLIGRYMSGSYHGPLPWPLDAIL